MIDIEISMVIPTRNRKDSLFRLLNSVLIQTMIPSEVIIVDSSEIALNEQELLSKYETLNIKLRHSKPSVCKQRNLGIQEAGGRFVFICDDDNELEKDYVSVIYQLVSTSDQIQISTGIAVTKDSKGEWVDNYPTSTNLSLWWRKFFYLGVWENVPNKVGLSNSIKKYYNNIGNDLTKAGWPLNTQWGDDVMICTVYGIGASMAKKSYWLSHPYDEVLDAHGLGDNYGVVMNDVGSIGVLKSVRHLHHQSPQNRLEKYKSYRQRVFALDYFLKTGKRFGPKNRRCLIWSLFGNLIGSLFCRDFFMVRINVELIWKLTLGANPYLTSSNRVN